MWGRKATNPKGVVGLPKLRNTPKHELLGFFFGKKLKVPRTLRLKGEKEDAKVSKNTF